MALSDEQKKEVLDLMSEAVATGLAKFRSTAEEEEAKRKQEEDKNKKEEGNNDSGNGDGFSFSRWILGG